MFEVSAEIVSNERLTHDTGLWPCVPSGLRKEPNGQFVMIRVSPGLDPLLRRPFSICGSRRIFSWCFTAWSQRHKPDERVEARRNCRFLDRWVRALPCGRKVQPASGWRRDRHCPLLFLSQFHREKEAVLMMGFRSAKDILSRRRLR